MNKLSVEILQEKSNIKYNGDYTIVGNYETNDSPLYIKHNICGNVSLTTPSTHLRNKGGCNFCFKNVKQTKEIFQENSNLIHNNEYLIIGDYINSDYKTEIKHLICGNIFYQSYDKHINSKQRCSYCYNTTGKLNKKLLQEKSNLKYNKEYTINGDYINNYTKIEITHTVCGNTYYQIPNNHLKRKCFFCYGTPLKTNEQFQKESDLIHNNGYKLIGDYINCKEKVKLLHLKCNRIFEQIAMVHLNGSVCSHCSMSKGETAIKNYLEKNNLNYELQKGFNDCKYIKTLRFDFYLPKFNLCIEFNGKQHYESIDFFGGDDGLKSNILRDECKKNYCISNNINYLIIKYDDYNNIDLLINEKIKIINEKI
jgi:hypothetical protein